MPVVFEAVTSFEDIAAMAVQGVRASGLGYTLNLVLAVEFPRALVERPQLLDAALKAELWQSIERPKELEFSHGEYIGVDGISHVISELRSKHAGNRALMSLISQKHIVGSGDNPIPAFLIAQFGIEEKNLVCTCYFRALEVLRFFPQNLEEIRMISKLVIDNFHEIEKVKLFIVAFRAYENSRHDRLEKAKLDTLGVAPILKKMEKDPSSLIELIREKCKHTTVVRLDSLKIIKEILDDPAVSVDVHISFRPKAVVEILARSIQLGKELAEARSRSSHHQRVIEKNEAYAEALERLASEIERGL